VRGIRPDRRGLRFLDQWSCASDNARYRRLSRPQTMMGENSHRSGVAGHTFSDFCESLLRTHDYVFRHLCRKVDCNLLISTIEPVGQASKVLLFSFLVLSCGSMPRADPTHSASGFHRDERGSSSRDAPSSVRRWPAHRAHRSALSRLSGLGSGGHRKRTPVSRGHRQAELSQAI
jgi:hypothetical protein